MYRKRKSIIKTGLVLNAEKDNVEKENVEKKQENAERENVNTKRSKMQKSKEFNRKEENVEWKMSKSQILTMIFFFMNIKREEYTQLFDRRQ